MPCIDAMITDVITAAPGQTVSEALALFETHRITSVPIIDDMRRVIGVFSLPHLMTNILPMALVPEAEGSNPISRLHQLEISLDSLMEAKPWVANRLILERPKLLGDTMIKAPALVRPDTPLREAIRLLVKYGSPLVVVADDEHTLAGLITYHKTLLALNRLVERTLRERAEGT